MEPFLLQKSIQLGGAVLGAGKLTDPAAFNYKLLHHKPKLMTLIYPGIAVSEILWCWVLFIAFSLLPLILDWSFKIAICL